MKTNTILFVFFLFCLPFLNAQSFDKDDVVGTWLNEDRDAKIEIYKESDKYFGKIIWLEEPNETTGEPKLDDENPERELQSRPIMNLVILEDFSFSGDDLWKYGTIYDPKSGNTYKCFIKMLSEEKLKIKGYVGFTWIGRTTYWISVK